MESVSSPSPAADAHVGVPLGAVHGAEPVDPARLAVFLDRISPVSRGRLAEVLDDAIEAMLQARGAAPPGIGAARDADSTLSDQLFRARQVGVSRVSLMLPSLRPIAGMDGALGVEDSHTLLFWKTAGAERPVEVTLDPSDATLPVHVSPVPLETALATRGHAPPAAALVPVTPVPAEEPVADTMPEPVAAKPTIEAVVEIPDVWRAPTLALTAARGPQPLATLERLFVSSYVPLDRAIYESQGTLDPRAVHARDEFRSNFSRVYSEACPAFAVTGKRPKMVLDAPEVAAKIARHASARSSQLLMVDSMRYDLGVLVKEALVASLGTKAALSHEMILWSAMPTTSVRQLTTLSRGVAALQAPGDEDRDEGGMRGRTAHTIRRLKIGSRDVYKLDVCDVRLRESGERAELILSAIASEAASVIAKYVTTLAPRTSLFIFGDHGFTRDHEGLPIHGGASPEEVLVPAFAFLVGDTH
jgi:hypothetical protein